MNNGEDRAKFFTAMAKAQGEFSEVLKSKEGYGYKYATLHSILDMARPILNRNGISISQSWSIEEDKVNLTTTLMHESGYTVADTCSAPLIELKSCNSLQSAGASITYVRRYHLEAVLGIAGDEDTDAHGEEKPKVKKEESGPTIQEYRERIGKVMTSGFFTEEEVDLVRNEVKKTRSVVTLRAILETWTKKMRTKMEDGMRATI